MHAYIISAKHRHINVVILCQCTTLQSQHDCRLFDLGDVRGDTALGDTQNFLFIVGQNQAILTW